MNKFLAKLIGWREKETNFAQKRFNEEATRESQLAAERQKEQQNRVCEQGWEEIPLPTEPVEKPEENQE